MLVIQQVCLPLIPSGLSPKTQVQLQFTPLNSYTFSYTFSHLAFLDARLVTRLGSYTIEQLRVLLHVLLPL